MLDNELRTMIDEVKDGRMDRRGFVQRMLAVGLTAPMATQLLAADGMSVTWKLKPGVKWHDGKPFTADDVVFNWEYARDPATATVTIGVHRDITVEKVDDLTVRILFKKPTPFWADAFVGAPGSIIPKHLFAQ